MPMVSIPEMKLQQAGIPTRYFDYSLRSLRGSEIHRHVVAYIKLAKSARRSGIGLCLYGESSKQRDQAFYGIAKALMANKYGVHVVTLEEMVEQEQSKSTRWDALMSVDFICIAELGIPDEMVSKRHKFCIRNITSRRESKGLPLIVATDVPVVDDEFSLDDLYPDISRILKKSTVLVNMSNDKLKWKHAVQVGDLK